MRSMRWLRAVLGGTRRRSILAAVVVAAGALSAWAALSLADNPSGCDFAATGTTESCSGPLTGSTFAGGDGNLATSPTTFGTTDWQNVSGRSAGVDLASGNGDNAFGQGTKEDDASVSVVTGSIPPNKSDLSRFYEASEFANGSNFLYLAWERTNVLGSANMDFEINQKTQPDLTTKGAKTLNRTAGDLLVTFDFNNGGGRPALGLLFWVTSGSTSQCFSANALPCWGNKIDLNSSNSIGAVNNLDAVNDPISGSSVPALQFGEAAINLTAAGVFPSGTCEAFGSAFLKSRASSSFPAEVKDFIAPIPVNISNCGQVTIIKHTDPRGIDQSFSYTSSIPNPASGSTTPSCSGDSTPSSFTLNDKGNTTADSAGNTEDCTNVPASSYTVTEGAEPANFTLESLTCTPSSGSSSGHQDATDPMKADITVAPGGHVTCTYTNQAFGAIKVTKTAKNHNLGTGNHPLAGATFQVGSVSHTTGADGTACFDGLTIGTAYTVTETAAPTGYAIDTASKSVTPTAAASCSSGTPTGVSFTDSPLTDLSVTATSEVAGVTNSKITCVDSGSSGIGNSPQGFGDPVTLTANGLKPGTYTCTVVVDP
jgi:Prealbumin-like fold domain